MIDDTTSIPNSSSRLIYLVDGAVLALVYFWIQTFGTSRAVILVAFLPTFLLVVLNLLHARLITVQHSWYSGIDARLRELVGVKEVEHGKKRSWLARLRELVGVKEAEHRKKEVEHGKRRSLLASTHGVYRAMHWAIAAVLFLIALAMLLYGLSSAFRSCPFPHRSKAANSALEPSRKLRGTVMRGDRLRDERPARRKVGAEVRNAGSNRLALAEIASKSTRQIKAARLP